MDKTFSLKQEHAADLATSRTKPLGERIALINHAGNIRRCIERNKTSNAFYLVWRRGYSTLADRGLRS